jgi:hypothetical protein
MEKFSNSISTLTRKNGFVKITMTIIGEVDEEHMKQHIANCMKFSKDRKEKDLVIFDMRDINSVTTAAVRRIINSAEIKKITKATAILTISPTLRVQLILTAILNLKKPPYPMNIFSNEDKAKAWLRQIESE